MQGRGAELGGGGGGGAEGQHLQQRGCGDRASGVRLACWLCIILADM